MNIDELNDEQKQFAQGMAAAGIPITEADLKRKFDEIAESEGVPFSNPSDKSPFYRFIRSALSKPALVLIEFMIRNVMPSQFLKTAVGWALDMHGWIYDLPRKSSAAAVGEITFYRANANTSITIPANRYIKTAPINGRVYRLKTTRSTSFISGQLSVRVPVIAEASGDQYNLADDYYTILELPITGVTRVTNESNWIITPGAQEELDEDYRKRIKARFTANSDYHVNSVYKSIIASFLGITYDRIFIDHTVTPRGPASCNAYILFDAGVAGSEYLTAVNAHIRDEGYHGFGDDMMVLPMPETHHDIGVTLYVKASVSSSERTEIVNEVEQIIRAAFRESLEYERVTRVRHNSRFSMQGLGVSIMSIIPELVSIEWGGDDIVSGVAIPRLNSITIDIEETL